jgi:hydroxymethylbilane synthase
VALRVGTRASALALAQARGVADRLDDAELVPITTAGDRDADAGDKSRWVSELERALLAGEIDLAVHSAKDVPGELPDGLAIVAVPARADPRDALCGAPGLDALRPGARVGTSSLRRRAQLLAARPDLDVVDLRGNVDTRLRRLADGDFDAVVLALAGLERLGRSGEAGAALDPDAVVPAPGQGCLALEARAGDEAVRAALDPLTDRAALVALLAERAVVTALDATCRTPVGAHARIADGGGLALSAFVGIPDGSAWARDALTGSTDEPAALGRAVAERLLAAGAGDLLAAAEAAA